MAESYSLVVVYPGQPGVLMRDDGACIPMHLDNLDYQVFLQWVAAGNPAPEGWTGPTNVVPVESP